MKKLVIGLLSLSFSVFAQLPMGNVSNFSGEYNEPSGVASSDLFKVGNVEYLVPTTYQVERQADKIFLEVNGESFEFDQFPVSTNDLSTLEWEGFNFDGDGNDLELSLGVLKGDSQDKENAIDIKKLLVRCSKTPGFIDERTQDELLDACLNKKGKLSFRRFYVTTKGKRSGFSGLSMSTNSNKLKFRMARRGPDATGNGEIFYTKDSIKIKINKVKAGPFSVTGTFFKEIRKQANEKLIVNRPWIEIILK